MHIWSGSPLAGLSNHLWPPNHSLAPHRQAKSTSQLCCTVKGMPWVAIRKSAVGRTNAKACFNPRNLLMGNAMWLLPVQANDQHHAMRLPVNSAQLQFAVVSASTFAVLGLIAFAWCGRTFVQETYLYHLWRKDPRHSFALHFYIMYLTEGSPAVGAWFGRYH